MTLSWSEHQKAHEELREAAYRYEDAGDSLGVRCLIAVQPAVESVLDPAYHWGYYRDRISAPQVYARSVAGFPFQIIYTLFEDGVFVLAYAHERRQPECWKGRLPS
ncbi:hypothetical protein G7067_07580 [Leucobacter insecticola]|uniref:Type II toxin-antitoxin system RelE/ParE family toxin n=1 Tax=Leucobacter insecticola TaxID=2714934 RepID=A0A6G8FIX0_9MICO|nr:hypothetical protein [Leucobacter insecticola]QIM16315.1 hypothetical protein G7067_07580 [Leucobacter insecticola]